MEQEEIRAAASSAAERTGADRIEYVQNSYPCAYWADILQLARIYNAEEAMFKYMNIGRDII